MFKRKKRETKKPRPRRRPRSDGKTLARWLDVLTVLALLAFLLSPMMVMALQAGGMPTSALLFPLQMVLACWWAAWRELETAVPTLSALLQFLCLAMALRTGARSARSRKEPEQEISRLNWTAAWCLALAGLFTVGTGWDIAFTRSPWALLGLARTAAALLAAWLVRRSALRLAEEQQPPEEDSNGQQGGQ